MTTSVVIPSSGREGVVERSIAPIAVQTARCQGVEVIIVDDSRDQSLQARLRQSGRPSNVRIIPGPQRGPGPARNSGAEAARGELLVFIDDDCVPEAPWLEAYQTEFVQNPDALLSGPIKDGIPDNLWSQAFHVILDYLYEAHLADGADLTGRASRTRLPFVSSANFAVGRNAFLALGGFDSSLQLAAEDRALSAKWLQRGGKLRRVPAAKVRNYHPLTLRQYVGQQFRYGRGAYQFRQSLKKTGAPQSFESPVFYAQLLIRATNEKRRRARVTGTVLMAQIALACGLGYEAWSAYLNSRARAT